MAHLTIIIYNNVSPITLIKHSKLSKSLELINFYLKIINVITNNFHIYMYMYMYITIHKVYQSQTC